MSVIRKGGNTLSVLCKEFISILVPSSAELHSAESRHQLTSFTLRSETIPPTLPPTPTLHFLAPLHPLLGPDQSGLDLAFRKGGDVVVVRCDVLNTLVSKSPKNEA
jgi:hypothetical protein